MRISSNDIKVKINYPEQYEIDEEIQSIISKWILDQQINRYGEETLIEAYSTWIDIEENKIN